MNKPETSQNKYDRVQVLVTQGSSIRKALAQIGMSPGSYYSIREKNIGGRRKPARRKSPKKLLHVQDLPSLHASNDRVFLLYGSPETLRQMMRGLE